MKVAYVQMEPVLLEPEVNYSRAEEMIREAVDRGAKLVVLPELFDTGYNNLPITIVVGWPNLQALISCLLADLLHCLIT